MRAGPSANPVVIRDRADGATSAAPAPCTTREAHQQHRVVRQAAGQRRGREDRQPDHEHAPAAERVRGAAAEDQQAAERDRVSGHDPLHRRGREAELALDRRERHVDDAEVQDDHERRGEDQRQGEPPVPRGCRGWPGHLALQRPCAPCGHRRRHYGLTYSILYVSFS